MKIQPVLTCVAVFAAAAFLASCGTSKPPASATAPDQTSSAATPGAKPATAGATGQAKPPVETSAGASAGASAGGKPAASVAAINDPNNILSKRSVYYDLDNYDVKPEFRGLVEAHARYLRDNPGARVTLEGNCDERGSREFNLALGARRAQAVKRALELAGANGDHINAVSYGAEKPVAAGKDEESYSQNRRVDIVY